LSPLNGPSGKSFSSTGTVVTYLNAIRIITSNTIIYKVLVSLRVPLNFGALEHRHHTNRDEGRFDDGQRSKPPEDILRVQGRVPLLVTVEGRAVQIFVILLDSLIELAVRGFLQLLVSLPPLAQSRLSTLDVLGVGQEPPGSAVRRTLSGLPGGEQFRVLLRCRPPSMRRTCWAVL
jgi:hypothetical protein